MESKVSRRLTEPVAPEVCEHIYAPRLARDFQAVFAHMTDLNQAHVLMLSACGLVSPAAARALAAGLLRMEEEGPGAVPLDPEREDSYFNYEAQLIRLIGADAGGRMHIARSRNDLTSALDRMRARDLLLDAGQALLSVEEHALDGAYRFRDVVMPGYTHLQPAQPVTYGFYLAGVAQSLARDFGRLSDAWARTNASPLGAGALAGTAFAIDRGMLAKSLGFDGLVENALDAVATRDFGLEILAGLSQVAIGWSRVAQDYHVLVSHEFQTIEFPDRVTGTSSIMPQKKNPVVLEHLKGKAGQMLGLYVAAASAVKGTHFTNTIDGNRETMRGVWEAGEETLRCLALFDLIIATARPNAALMRRRVTEDFCAATDLADLMVREAGLSFREAHHVVGAVVRAAMDAGLSAEGITPAMVDAAALSEAGRALHLPEEAVRQSLDPALSVAARTLPGGPAPEAVARSVEAAQARLEARRAALVARRTQLQTARDALKRAVRELAA
ncbi:argininosuccinate lyase [Methylobacterium sp. 174MFSha1.1]|uniref:argininosuccinate lyase n=1 Tax=Methylobacterium sp. 174MFSha1.1 TaxID=1502749 RepID=UPI0008E6CF05|nr:argininosuccinate lyase [Methylobacterium sp. 174MFSha1.1]SFU93978.1 argininosuccinate lyase [Methylobacterium sp. 174MFSha1.1]